MSPRSWVTLAASSLNMLAFGSTIAAELSRSTATIAADAELNYRYCLYDSNIATIYGICALLLLLASHFLVMVPTQCFWRTKGLNPSALRSWSSLLFITFWVTFLAAEVCLVVGSVINAKRTKYRIFYENDPPACITLRKGVFGAAAVLIFITTVISQLYYVCYFEDEATPSHKVDDIVEEDDLKKNLISPCQSLEPTAKDGVVVTTTS